MGIMQRVYHHSLSLSKRLAHTAAVVPYTWRISWLGSTAYARIETLQRRFDHHWQAGRTRLLRSGSRIKRSLLRMAERSGNPEAQGTRKPAPEQTTTRPHRTAIISPSTATPMPRQPAQPLTGWPIVFMHRNNSAYLQYTLGQARLSNPGSPIYLLGDTTNNCYPFVEHKPFLDYFEQARAFSKVYRHYTTNGYTYTLFDFQRWLILYEFLVAHGYTRCLYLDSDVMLYTDVTRDLTKFEAYDFCIAQMTGSVFVLNDLLALKDFGQFMMDIYTRKDRYHFDRMVAHYAMRKKNGLAGGACDMMVLYYYREANFGRVGEVSQIIDGSIYDLNISVAQGFAVRDGIKQLEQRDDGFYGYHLRTKRAIRFNSLHFQGSQAKRLIPQYYVGTQGLDRSIATVGRTVAEGEALT